MSTNTTEVSKCGENGEGKVVSKSLPRCKQQSRAIKAVKTVLSFVLKRPVVLRWAIVHLPDAAAAVEMWGKKVVAYFTALIDMF